MIPKTLHYIFGMSPESGGKPWSLIHYACLRSAVENIRPKDLHFYCETEPTGPWWEVTRKYVNVERIKAPREIFGNPLVHPAHRADVVRLERLISSGGIYLDVDVLVHRSFDELLGNTTVLGKQILAGDELGLCNAVILSEAQAPFLIRWLSEYHSFRSRGRDAYWDEHSVRIPLRLSREFPEEVTALPYNAFFWPTFSPPDLKLIFDSPAPIDVSKGFATHLWESLVWESHLEYLTPARVRAIESNFHRWVRPYVASLPDSYGAPTLSNQLAVASREIKRRMRSITPSWAIRLKHLISD